MNATARLLSAPPDALAAFAELLRERLGLGRLAAREELLARRLCAAMELAGLEHEAPEAVVEALRAAPLSSRLWRAVADAVPNHETSFFRDEVQLRGVWNELVPPRAVARACGDRLRILSAGCATGEEAFSLSMLGLDLLHRLHGRDFEVHGVDVSGRAVGRAMLGAYRGEALQRAGRGPDGWVDRFFRRADDLLEAREILRTRTRFSVGNLMQPRELQRLGRFDIVLCRNVFLYFDPESALRATQTLRRLLAPGGAIVVSPAEVGAIEPILPGLRQSGALCWFEPEAAR